MDRIIASLEKGQPAFEEDILKVVSLFHGKELKSGTTVKLTDNALKAWKILHLLSKPKGPTDAMAAELAEACAKMVSLAEDSLQLKRLDFEKLLVGVFGHMSIYKDCSELTTLINRRIMSHFPAHSNTSCNEFQIGKFPDVSGLNDVDLVNVVVLFLAHLCSRKADTDTWTKQLYKFMDVQHRLSQPAFFKLFNFIAQKDYKTAVLISIHSDADLYTCLKALTGVSHTPFSLDFTNIPATRRTLVICCALDIDIPDSRFSAHEEDILWTVANGSIPAPLRFNSADITDLVLAMRRFQKIRNSLQRTELIELLQIIDLKCDHGESCKLWNMCLKLLSLETIDNELLNLLSSCASNHSKCSRQRLFSVGVHAFKTAHYQAAIILIKASLLKECNIDDDTKNNESQKHEYLSLAYQSSNLPVDSLRELTTAIDLSCSAEVIVLGRVPHKEQNSQIVRRIDRWIRLIQHMPDTAKICEELLPRSLKNGQFFDVFVSLILKYDFNSRIQSVFTSLFPVNTFEMLKRLYDNYTNLNIEHVKIMEGLLSLKIACNGEDLYNCKILLNALKHFVGIACYDDILECASYKVKKECSRIRDLLLSVYNVQHLLSMPISNIGIDIDLSNLEHLIFVSWKFLCRSIDQSGEGRTIESIELAMKSQRIFDLILRCLATSKTNIQADDKLRIDAIAGNLFTHLAIMYGQRPFVREARYYLKQAMTSAINPTIRDRHAGILNAVENGIPITYKLAGASCMCSPAYQSLASLDKFISCSLVCEGSRRFKERPQNQMFQTAFENLKSEVCRGNRLKDDALDRFGLLSLKYNYLEDFIRLLEYNQSVLNLNFQYSANVDIEREALCSIVLPSGDTDGDSISISLLRNNEHSLSVFWIVFKGQISRAFRVPISQNTIDSWQGELDAIEKSNKSLLKKRDNMTSEDKRMWWDCRFSLDRRLASFIQTVRQFLTVFIDWKSVKSDHILVGDNLLNLDLISLKFSDQLVDLLFMSKRIQEIDVSRQEIASRLEQLQSNDELDNVFVAQGPQKSSGRVLCLYLSAGLAVYPWENIFDESFLRCIPILLVVPSNSPAINPNHHDIVSYVINPSGDLVETERRLAPLVTASTKFNGVMGRPPSEQELIEFLTTSKLYLYCGHGGGDAYLSASKIAKQQQIAPSLLIGCSSGKLRHVGSADPEGNPIAYCRASSPFVVCNLWDVTDKDIDAFTLRLLNNIIRDEVHDAASVAQIVSLAKKECTLKYINGAAPVVYQPVVINKLD